MTVTNYGALKGGTNATTSAGAMAEVVRRPSIVEFLRYFLCSAAALAVDVCVFAFAMRIGLPYLVAASAGFAVGLGVAYILSVRWAFSQRSVANHSLEFALFAAIGVLGLMLTDLLLWILVGQFELHPMVAKAATAGAVFLFNFGARKAMLFTRPQ